MPRKNAMRDSVNAVRTRLPHLSELSREKIELALLHYESNIDATVEAFKRNGAIEALGGWTEMSNSRGNTSTKRMNNKPLKSTTTTSSQVPPSNGILRPSQRVSNIFQTFAEGGVPTSNTNGSTTVSNTVTCSPVSLIEQSDNNLQSSSYLNHDNHDTIADDINEQRQTVKSQRRRSSNNRNGSTSSTTQNHELSLIIDEQKSTNNSLAQTTTVTKSSSSTPTIFGNNKKALTKSAKDLQRQTSTISNVELLFNNEIKSSIKRIDDLFKQIREIIKEREVELYLEMDQVKKQGLNIIHRRQQRAIELRQRIDRCDRLEPSEIDHLRDDIKQFVTDRRYDLGEELTSAHRFEYDQTLLGLLKNFGHVSTVDRKTERGRTISTSSALAETSTTAAATEEKPVLNVLSPEKAQISMTNGRTPSISSPSNEIVFTNYQQEPLPQRVNKEKTSNRSAQQRQSNGEIPTNGNLTGDYHQNSYSPVQSNGHYQHYQDANNYQNVNRRRPQQYSQGNLQRPRAIPNEHNRPNVPKQTNGRLNTYNNSETTNTYRRPRPPLPSQSIVPVQT